MNLVLAIYAPEKQKEQRIIHILALRLLAKLHAFQLWVNLPRRDKMTKPRKDSCWTI